MKFRADLHVHSTFSDGKLSIPELVDFYGAHGFGAVAITDHLCEESSFLGKAARVLDRTLTKENFPIYKDIIEHEAERAWDQYRMLLIPGFEITKNYISNKRSAHILGLGITDFVEADGDVIDIAKRIRNQGGLVVGAHPVSTQKIEKQTHFLWDRRRELAQHFDAWEVASGPYLFKEVHESGLPMLATSDLHRPSQISSYKTIFECELNRDAMFQAIKQQNLRFEYYDVRGWIDPNILPAHNGAHDIRNFLDTPILKAAYEKANF